MKLFDLKIWCLLWFYKTYYGYFKVSVKCLYAQAKHETGNFTSEVFKDNNNLFGMRQAFIRPRDVEGTRHNHAYYKNHRQSVIDYFLRQKYYKLGNLTDEEFMQATIQSNYAEDTSYITKWKAHILQVKTPFLFSLIIYGGLFFLFVMPLLYFIIKLFKKH